MVEHSNERAHCHDRQRGISGVARPAATQRQHPPLRAPCARATAPSPTRALADTVCVARTTHCARRAVCYNARAPCAGCLPWRLLLAVCPVKPPTRRRAAAGGRCSPCVCGGRCWRAKSRGSFRGGRTRAVFVRVSGSRWRRARRGVVSVLLQAACRSCLLAETHHFVL